MTKTISGKDGEHTANLFPGRTIFNHFPVFKTRRGSVLRQQLKMPCHAVKYYRPVVS